MGLFLLRFWPVLIPLVVYALWLYNAGRKANKTGKPCPRFQDGPWYWVVLSSLLIGIACFIALGTSLEHGTGRYSPPHMENGVLVPGQVSDRP